MAILQVGHPTLAFLAQTVVELFLHNPCGFLHLLLALAFLGFLDGSGHLFPLLLYHVPGKPAGVDAGQAGLRPTIPDGRRLRVVPTPLLGVETPQSVVHFIIVLLRVEALKAGCSWVIPRHFGD